MRRFSRRVAASVAVHCLFALRERTAGASACSWREALRLREGGVDSAPEGVNGATQGGVAALHQQQKRRERARKEGKSGCLFYHAASAVRVKPFKRCWRR